MSIRQYLIDLILVSIDSIYRYSVILLHFLLFYLKLLPWLALGFNVQIDWCGYSLSIDTLARLII